MGEDEWGKDEWRMSDSWVDEWEMNGSWRDE